MIEIKKATKSKLNELVKLELLLWENHTEEELKEETLALMNSKNNIFFLAYDGKTPVGFCHVSLKYEYVEGANTRPVGYLEGIFVEKDYRRRGIAKQLVQIGELFAKQKGSKELASDCELDNKISEKFHLKIGFSEASKNIHFIKKL